VKTNQLIRSNLLFFGLQPFWAPLSKEKRILSLIKETRNGVDGAFKALS